LDVLHRISDRGTADHKWLTRPRGGNILRVNLKSRFSPYVVVDPRNAAIDCYAGEIIPERSMFPWWNHWPVSQQIRSNGRWALAPDRASHSSLAHIQSWRPYEETPDGVTMLMLNGLTEKSAEGLLPLAKSWLHPAPLTVSGQGFAGTGYDPAQRAYVVERRGPAGPAALSVELGGSAESPVVNPALLVRGWGSGLPRITIDGRPAPLGPLVRAGLLHNLDGEDLIVWIRKESEAPVRIVLTPQGDKP
jgi:hypothetical protein